VVTFTAFRLISLAQPLSSAPMLPIGFAMLELIASVLFFLSQGTVVPVGDAALFAAKPSGLPKLEATQKSDDSDACPIAPSILTEGFIK